MWFRVQHSALNLAPASPLAPLPRTPHMAEGVGWKVEGSLEQAKASQRILELRVVPSGLVFQAHRRLYQSTQGSRVMKKKRRRKYLVEEEKVAALFERLRQLQPVPTPPPCICIFICIYIYMYI